MDGGGARLAIGGGVAANGAAARAPAGAGRRHAREFPPRELCTDNAAMIASAARSAEPLPFPAYSALDAYASGERALA